VAAKRRQSANMDSGESLRQSSFGLPVGCGATYLPAVGARAQSMFLKRSFKSETEGAIV
jgi:hypothetical protein